MSVAHFLSEVVSNPEITSCLAHQSQNICCIHQCFQRCRQTSAILDLTMVCGNLAVHGDLLNTFSDLEILPQCCISHQCFCKQYTLYVTFSHAVNTHITLHGLRMCWCASCHLHGHPCRAPECCLFLDSLFTTLFLSVCFSYPSFFYQNLELNLFLHVAVIGPISHWHSAN